MSKRETPKVVGYLLLLVSLVLLIGYAAINIFLLSQRVQAPIPKGPGTISLKVAGGRAYFVAGNTLYALRTSNGKQLWRFQKDGLGEPVIAGGLVYEVAPESIYALRGSDGKQLWQYRITESNNSKPLVIVDGLVYVYNGQTLYILRASNGTLAWSADNLQTDYSNVMLMTNGAVYYGAYGYIYARQASDGKELWQYRINGSSCFVLQFASVQGAVYVSASCTDGYKQPNQTIALRASDGEQLWDATNIGGHFTVTDGIVCVYDTQWAYPSIDPIYALRMSDGKLLWRFQLKQDIFTPQVWVPGNGLVYEVLDNHLYVLRSSDGELAWSLPQSSDTRHQYHFPEPVFLSFVNDMMYLYTGGYDLVTNTPFGGLYALQASTGKQVWTFQQNWSLQQEIHHSTLTWRQLTMDSGVVYIQALDQQQNPTTHILALRASDGALLGSLQLNIREANITMVDGIIYADLIINDTTSFSYFLTASQATSSGGKELWEFLG